VLSFLNYWRVLANRTICIDEFCSINKLAAFVALISMAAFESTERASTLDITISKEFRAAFTKTLAHLSFGNKAIVLELKENILGNLGVFLCGSSSEDIKVDLKPFVDISLDCKILITDFFWSHFIFQSLHFSCSSILVSSADIKGIVSS